jgi:hypothetical protein
MQLETSTGGFRQRLKGQPTAEEVSPALGQSQSQADAACGHIRISTAAEWAKNASAFP